MLITSRQTAFLKVGGLTLMLCGLGLTLLLNETLRAWTDMSADATRRLDAPILPAVHLLTPVLAEVLLIVILFVTGLMAWTSARWFQLLGERPSAAEAGAGQLLVRLGQVMRVLVPLTPFVLLAIRVRAEFVPNPTNWLSLAPPGIYAMFMIGLVLVLTGPLCALTWLGLGQWLRWMALVRRARQGERLPGGLLQRRFGDVRHLLLFGGTILSVMGAYLLPIVRINADFNGATLHVQEVLFNHRPYWLFAVALLFMLGGGLLLTWRLVGRQVGYHFDPQEDHMHGALSRLARARRQAHLLPIGEAQGAASGTAL